jgi:hypothetical protein
LYFTCVPFVFHFLILGLLVVVDVDFAVS